MESSPRKSCLLPVVISFCLLHLVTVSQGASMYNDEDVTQAVEIKIYDTNKDDWTANSNDFKVLVSEYASYCNAYLSQCGLLSLTSFQSSDVVASSVVDEGSSVLVSVYILYPTGVDINPNGSTQYILPKDATIEILSDVRDAYHTSSRLWMTYIGDDYYSIPPNEEVNRVVIPLVILAVGATGIFTAFLKYYEERKTRKDKLKERMKEKKKRMSAMQDLPNYNNNILETTTTTVLSNNTPRNGIAETRNRNHNAAWNMDQGVPTVSKMISMSQQLPSVNYFHDGAPPPKSVNKTDTPTKSMKKNGLKPLELEREVPDAEVTETDAERKERRRRKKEKKREKRRLQELEMREQQGMDSSNVSDHEVDGSRSNVQTFSVGRDSAA